VKHRADESEHVRWGRFRFSVVGPLLASPPPKGKLRAQLRSLAGKTYKHPITGDPATFGLSTIERWYYQARNARDPVGAVRRRIRSDAAAHPSVSLPLRQVVRAQHREHPHWSYQLHFDNLKVVVAQQGELGALPSYATVRRWMKSQGLTRQRRRRPRDTAGGRQAEERLQRREVRSFEAEYVDGLWHADFHQGSRKVLLPWGEWLAAHLLAVLDDRSRLVCHAQWYLEESAESFVHGLSQAIQKRGLPRSLMTDRGGPMLSAETQQGLEDLGILHEPTLPYSAYQNAKQEVLWASVEGRLLAMLEGVEDLTLELLNEATLAWVELEYNRKIHSEVGTTPLARYLEGPGIGRPSPSSEEIRRAFRARVLRTQRRSDGTITVEGVRFEIPSRFRHIERLCVRYARWDLASIDLVDERTGKLLCALYPLDKAKNAREGRKNLEPISAEEAAAAQNPPAGGVAPLLKKLMADYAATGLPPAYLPKPHLKEDSR
jgi:transposase InsO family protein